MSDTIAQPIHRLSEEELRRARRYVQLDGFTSLGMAGLTSGVLLVGFALELGASNRWIGLLAAIPPLASLLQLPAIYLVNLMRNRRLLYIAAMLPGRAVWLLVAFLPFLVPPKAALLGLAAAMAFNASLGAVATCAWASWTRDLVPMGRYGEFFSRRLKFAMIMGMVLSLLGALLIDAGAQWLDTGLFGYAALFILGFGGGMLGLRFVARIPEPEMRRVPTHFLNELAEPLQNRNFARLLLVLGGWNVAVNLAAPFFAVYMMTQLHLSLTATMGITVIGQLTHIASIELWGRISDDYSNKGVLLITGSIFLLCLFAMTFTGNPGPHDLTIPLLIGIHLVMGIATAGITLAGGNIGYKLAPDDHPTPYLALQGVVIALAAGAGPLIGGLFADYFAVRELDLTLNWHSPETAWALDTLNISGWDFFFAFAFLLGGWSLLRLRRVEETGDAPLPIIFNHFVGAAGREARNLSTVAGLRSSLFFPIYRRLTNGNGNGGEPPTTTAA